MKKNRKTTKKEVEEENNKERGNVKKKKRKEVMSKWRWKTMGRFVFRKEPACSRTSFSEKWGAG